LSIAIATLIELAQKFAGTPDADEIRQVKTPLEAAKIGRDLFLSLALSVALL
jgi:predicted NAD-dependent protein-ADP-ribosyltransferase YbiA (DUF1768 family)